MPPTERSKFSPPQIQLTGTSKKGHGRPIKAEPLAIKDYAITRSSTAARSQSRRSRDVGTSVVQRIERANVPSGRPGRRGRQTGPGATRFCGTGWRWNDDSRKRKQSRVSERDGSGARYVDVSHAKRCGIPKDLATRQATSAKQQLQQNRFVIIGAGALRWLRCIGICCGFHAPRKPAKTTKADDSSQPRCNVSRTTHRILKGAFCRLPIPADQ